MKPDEINPILARGFRRRESETRLTRRRLVAERCMRMGQLGRGGRVDLDIRDTALLTIALAASDSALHAPEATRRYPGLRAQLVYRHDPIVKAPVADRLAGALARLRDEPHTLIDAGAHLIRASMSDEGRYRLAGAFRLLVYRDIPFAELAAGSRGDETFLLRYVGNNDIASLASMPGYSPAAGASVACVLHSDLFAALGEAFEAEAKRTAAELRPGRRERVTRSQAPDADMHGRKNKTAGVAEQAPTDPLSRIGLDDQDSGSCLRTATRSRRRASG